MCQRVDVTECIAVDDVLSFSVGHSEPVVFGVGVLLWVELDLNDYDCIDVSDSVGVTLILDDSVR